MRVACLRSLPILILGALAAIQPASAAAASASDPLAPLAAPATYPEIVRLTYVEGDVRVSRGKPGEKADEGESGATGWEQAAAGLPLESGYSLVTGKGRAEIELEDASTVYLGEDSVLTFDELTATAGIPYSELSLLSGVATMNVHATLPGEFFRLNTPTDHISLPYPHGAIWRVNSYLDAISVTPLQDLTVRQPGAAPATETLGKTVSYSHGHIVATPVQPDASASAEWDHWVAARIVARDAAMSAAMKQAGLTAPLPGLDQMNGQGAFFACAPYGTCWAPSNGWDGKSPADANAAPKPVAMPRSPQRARLLTVAFTVASTDPPAFDDSQLPASAPGSSKKSARLPGQSVEDAFLATHPGATFYTDDYTFPCSIDSVSDLIGVDPITGKESVLDSELDPFPFDAFFLGFPHRGFGPFLGYDAYWGYNAWDWTVCHTGAWIRWRHRYVWVAGNKRHHRPPVRWVKSGRTVGFVPIHPRDVAGKPPLNLKSGVFHVTTRNGVAVERVALNESEPLKLLAEPPKEFRDPPLEPLKIAETPHPLAHSAWSSMVARNSADRAGAHGAVVDPAGKSLVARSEGVPITFDRKTQSFFVARQVSGQGGKIMTASTPLGGGRANNSGGNGFSGARGGGSSAQGRAGSSGGSSSASRGGGGGGGGYSAGASRGGGGGFSGGGGGGGASHASGGGGGGGGGGAASGGGGGHK